MRQAASHEDTSSDRPHTGRGLRPRPIRLGHMTNSLFTLQTTYPAPGGIPRGVSCFSKRRWAPSGGGERVRTDDLLLAKQALSQLSYTPGPEIRSQRSEIRSVF